MKSLKQYGSILLIAASVAAMPACKSKKAVVAPPPPPKPPVEKPATPPPPPPVKEETPAPPPPPAAPNYNFSNIQFEFNSGILKTDSYALLDKAVAEMKKDDAVSFMLDGHSSAEGSEKHNMDLSVERANSVKTYLTNSGISANRLTVKGFGESKPISSNTDEASRALNRRVEIKKQ
ncbi:OmpA family protein [Mucilaginibacter sp. UR6-1]|uniref:OmpA family protein n=1 Tax=Mucilaginibacter sp. UR6-1 TaxID=1435643 RepID=UPI001E3D4287|nr:OmpA family protein [Mucilaginibacter sp. UR6-1]MCC8409398.1 OmpA family protein [Mucilaginibacter sp. UR6-1]